MSATLVSNGDSSAGKSVPAPVISRVASVYSEVQTTRIEQVLPLPSVLRKPFKINHGPASSAAGNPGHFSLRTFSPDPWGFMDKMLLILFDLLLKLFCLVAEQSLKGERKQKADFFFYLSIQ